MNLRWVLTTALCLLIAVDQANEWRSSGGQPDLEQAIADALEAIPAERVTLTTGDGVQIAAIHRAPEGDSPRPAVLMLHGSNQRKEYFWIAGVAEALLDNNYHLLSIDIRGRGESGAGDAEALRSNPALAHKDIDAALAWLRAQPGVDAERIALIGASYGANLCTSWLMLGGEGVRTNIALSATAVSFKFPSAYSDRQAGNIACSGLYLAGDDEVARYDAAETARRLAQITDGRARAEIYEGNTHAFGTIIKYPEALDLIDRWLAQELEGAEIDAGQERREPADDGDSGIRTGG